MHLPTPRIAGISQKRVKRLRYPISALESFSAPFPRPSASPRHHHHIDRHPGRPLNRFPFSRPAGQGAWDKGLVAS